MRGLLWVICGLMWDQHIPRIIKKTVDNVYDLEVSFRGGKTMLYNIELSVVFQVINLGFITHGMQFVTCHKVIGC